MFASIKRSFFLKDGVLLFLSLGYLSLILSSCSIPFYSVIDETNLASIEKNKLNINYVLTTTERKEFINLSYSPINHISVGGSAGSSDFSIVRRTIKTSSGDQKNYRYGGSLIWYSNDLLSQSKITKEPELEAGRKLKLIGGLSFMHNHSYFEKNILFNVGVEKQGIAKYNQYVAMIGFRYQFPLFGDESNSELGFNIKAPYTNITEIKVNSLDLEQVDLEEILLNDARINPELNINLRINTIEDVTLILGTGIGIFKQNDYYDTFNWQLGVSYSIDTKGRKR